MVGVAGYHPDDYMIFFAWVSYSIYTFDARNNTLRLVMPE
jgi:hypothetical protein